MFRIWCKVSGGITGTRAGYAKDENSQSGYEEYESYEEAMKICKERNQVMNMPYKKADYSYTVIKINDSSNKTDNDICEVKPKLDLYTRNKSRVYATGNKWAIENFHATHN